MEQESHEYVLADDARRRFEAAFTEAQKRATPTDADGVLALELIADAEAAEERAIRLFVDRKWDTARRLYEQAFLLLRTGCNKIDRQFCSFVRAFQEALAGR